MTNLIGVSSELLCLSVTDHMSASMSFGAFDIPWGGRKIVSVLSCRGILLGHISGQPSSDFASGFGINQREVGVQLLGLGC